MDQLCKAAKIDRSHSGGHGNPIAVSEDGQYSIEFVECLASCGTGPVCMVNDDFYEGVKDEEVPKILEKYQ
jgi:NADH-quinone oxidoreductase subunit E